MSLATQIDADLKSAMLARDAERTGVLRMFKSALKYQVIERAGADAVASDEDVVLVARREIKKRQDSVASYTQAGRTDLADKEKGEIVFLEAYLPAAMSDAELDTLVDKAIAEAAAAGSAQMGAVMKIAQTLAAGRADGKTLSAKVRAKLPPGK
jgi:uncharacterized protein YqeY